jgi:protein-S-isoprenylcysteine O-methyltransferase Ste14
MGAASDFEFKNRFWIFGGLFWLAFTSYWFGDQNAGASLVDAIARLRGVAATDWQYHAIFGVAALFCLANAAVRTWGTAYLNSEVMVDKRLHTSRLVADGPYRYVRNPLYFGNILLAIGFGFMAGRLGFFVLVLGMILYSYRLILREEAGIEGSQGESYRTYCATVPRLLPTMQPKLPPSGATPNWADAFLGEAFMWTMAASVVAFAITLKQVVFFVVLASAFVVYALCYAVIVKRQKARKAGAQPESAEHPPKQMGQSNSSST